MGERPLVIDGWVNLPQMSEELVAQSPALKSVTDFFGGGGALLAKRTVDDLLAAMDAAKVERALLAVGPNASGADRRLGLLLPTLDEGLDAVARSGGRLRLIVAATPMPDVVESMRQVRGIGDQPEVAAMLVGAAGLEWYLTDRRLYPIYAACAEAGLPVVCNVGIFGPPMPSKYQHPMLLEEILADFPGLTVIAAHMGHPWERLLIRLMMKFPHLFLMTSAYLPKYLDPAVVEFMNSRRGDGRVIYGSDWPMLPIDRAVQEARKLPLSPAALDGYLGENLARVIEWHEEAT